jgi:2,4-dienoyl-CoA reductase-like NADH-dependent reductase (Old Yellow Enzyme family)
MTKPLLSSPIALRGLTPRNRVVISPMCQYSAAEGMAADWHFAHLARFAIGGAGLVFSEAAAVERNGRITHGDLGIWSDAHIPPLARITSFLKSQGAVPAIQLAHAGRKASMQRPWHGNGPMDDSVENDFASWPMQSGWWLDKRQRSLTPEDAAAAVKRAAGA